MNEQDDFHWLAWRYVAGELDEAETQAFESRLESDQSAREAVAQVVMLTRCVAAAAAADPTSRSEPWCELAADRSTGHRSSGHGSSGHGSSGHGSSWGWVAALVVSAALLVLVSQFMRSGGRGRDTTAFTSEAAMQAQWAEVWDAVREPLDEPAWTADVWDEEEDGSSDAVASLAETSVDGSDVFWIEAAVIGLSEVGSDAGPLQ